MDIFQMIDPGNKTADFQFMKQHPRLLFTKEKIAKSKEHINKLPLYQRFFNEIQQYADNALKDVIPKQVDEHFGFVWRYSAYLPIVASVYLFKKEKEYFDCIIKWLKEFLNYEFSLEHPCLPLKLSSIASCLVYDWLYDELPDDLREQVKNKLLINAEAIYRFAQVPYRDTWNKSVMQNHNHIAMAALGTIGLTLYEDCSSKCQNYVNMAVTRFCAMFETMGDDGAFHEGFGYWYYGFMTPFMLFQMLHDNTNLNFFDLKWFENVPDYLLFHYFPENHFSSEYEYFSFADDIGYKRTKECMIRLIAKITNHSQLQYLAQMSYDKKLSTYHGSFLNLIWNDPDLEAVSPKESKYPTSHLFDNYGYAFARDNWSGEECCLGVHCGTPLGEKWGKVIKTIPFFELGAGHVHPDAGHFTLFGKGQVLFRDDEYSYFKQTVQHNTILINDAGQLGENTQWFHESRYYLNSKHKIEFIDDTKDYIMIAADLKDAYGKDSKLTVLKRYYILLKNKDCLIIYDQVRAEKENKISAYFWPWGEHITKYDDHKFLITDEKANVKLVSSSNLTNECITKEIHSRYYKKNRNAVSFSDYSQNGDYVYAITFSASDKEPAEIKINTESNRIVAILLNKKYIIDPQKRSVIIFNQEETVDAKLPVSLFSNGVQKNEFQPDIKEYQLKKLPWQKKNSFFFTGSDTATIDYKAEFIDEYPVGLGNIPIKDVTASSYYLNNDAKKAIADNEEMWTADLMDSFLLIELKELTELKAVVLSFGYAERFHYNIEIKTSADGVIFDSVYTGSPKDETSSIAFKQAVKAKFVKVINKGTNYNSFLNIKHLGLI